MISGPTIRRSGMTLVEVLVAIFVMGIGLLALLTLFPLGALRMGTAFKDERCAQAVNNARSIAQMFNLRQDPNVVGLFQDGGTGQPTAKYLPSYPVFVDPAGMASTTIGSIPRTVPSILPMGVGNQGAIRFFQLNDDLTFQRNYGVPYNFGSSTTQVVEGEAQYSWAYMLQRPRMSDSAFVNCSVCVFQRRPKAGTLETVYPTATNTVTISPLTAPSAIQISGTPNIQAGQWVLDCSTIKVSDSSSGTKIDYQYSLANFYRITGVRESNTSVTLDLQTPLLGYENTTASMSSQVVILEGLAEVFDLGPGR